MLGADPNHPREHDQAGGTRNRRDTTVRIVRRSAECQYRQLLRGAKLPTLAHAADDSVTADRSTVRANPLKTNGETDADGADAKYRLPRCWKKEHAWRRG
jgi:hypothetical protein